MAKIKRQPRGAGAARQLPSGRWQAKVKVGGKYHAAPHTFDTKAAAQAWLQDQNRDLAAGTWEAPERDHDQPMKFREFAEAWLITRDLKPRTRSHYRKILDDALLPFWGTARLNRITVTAVERWYASLDPSTPTLRAHTYAVLRTILHSAWRRDLIESNPCRVEGAGSVKRATKTDLPSAVQVHALAAAMPGKYGVMVLLAAWCGLRFGELTELRGSDVVTEDGQPVALRVRRAVVRVDGEYIVGTPKSEAGVRDVVLPPHIRPEVGAYLTDTKPAKGALLFPGKQGQHMASSSLYWHFGTARKAKGVDLPTLRWHDLRHFAGTVASQSGASIAEVMGRLGHSTTQAAMRYQHSTTDRDTAIAEAMSATVIPLRPAAKNEAS